MNKIIKIYCEGKKGSHDFDILEKVIHGLSPAQILIEPIGSVRGAGAIIQYNEKGITKSDFKLFFRDRDFDKPIPEKPVLEQDNERKYFYYSYRTTIENYLFDTSIFYSFLKYKKLDIEYKINSEEEVKIKFIETAKKIKYYQATRHTMGKMRTGKTNFGTKWTTKSGILPKNLEENFCKQKALDKIKKAKKITNSWEKTNFNEIYNSFINKFNENFINNLDFFIYFQGKDFASALKLIIPNFPIEKYYKYAKKHFDYTKFKDLIELKNLIATKL